MPDIKMNPLTRAMTAKGFAELLNLGWPDLLPIVPPVAQLHEHSRLLASSLGKVPGVRAGVDAQGRALWMGMRDWTTVPFGPTQAALWESWRPCNIGMRCERIVAIDSDISDGKLAQSLHRAILDLHGKLKGDRRRYGQFPKWTWILRLPPELHGQVKPWRVKFAAPDGKQHMVELLGHGKHTVVFGIHPKTGDAYQWATSATSAPFDEHFQAVNLPFIERLQARILEWVGEQGCTVLSSAHADGQPLAGALGKTPPPRQSDLLGQRDLCLEALRAIDVRMDYEDWLTLLRATRAACEGQDWAADAREAFYEMSERVASVDEGDEVGEDLLRTVTRKWDSLKPPHYVGAEYLIATARSISPHRFAPSITQLDPGLAAFASPAALARVAAASSGAPDPFEGLDASYVPAAAAHVAPLQQTQMAAEVAGLFSDQAVALRFAERFRNEVAFVPERGQWLVRRDTLWQEDPGGKAVQQRVSSFILSDLNRLVQTHADKADPKVLAAWRKEGGGEPKVRRVFALTGMFLTLSASQFDAAAWALNTPAGVVDLRAGDLVRLEPDLIRFTRRTAVAPAPKGTPAPQWLKFLDQVTEGDLELQAWLQRAAGYTLAGDLTEQVVIFLYGPGGNGKSVFLNALAHVLGTYAGPANQHAFMASRSEAHATQFAGLAGNRMVLVPELPEGRWNESMLKAWSAGEIIRARFMRGDEFSFRATSVLWFSGNDRPALTKVDQALERRFRLVTFDYTPATPDKGLLTRLTDQEGPAILRWALDGYAAWRREGLGSCAAIRRATGEYFSEYDPIRTWLQQRTEADPGVELPTADLFTDFQKWAQLATWDVTTKIKAMNLIWFARRLKAVAASERAFTVDRDPKNTSITCGLRLRK